MSSCSPPAKRRRRAAPPSFRRKVMLSSAYASSCRARATEVWNACVILNGWRAEGDVSSLIEAFLDDVPFFVGARRGGVMYADQGGVLASVGQGVNLQASPPSALVFGAFEVGDAGQVADIKSPAPLHSTFRFPFVGQGADLILVPLVTYVRGVGGCAELVPLREAVASLRAHLSTMAQCDGVSLLETVGHAADRRAFSFPLPHMHASFTPRLAASLRRPVRLLHQATRRPDECMIMGLHHDELAEEGGFGEVGAAVPWLFLPELSCSRCMGGIPGLACAASALVSFFRTHCDLRWERLEDGSMHTYGIHVAQSRHLKQFFFRSGEDMCLFGCVPEQLPRIETLMLYNQCAANAAVRRRCEWMQSVLPVELLAAVSKKMAGSDARDGCLALAQYAQWCAREVLDILEGAEGRHQHPAFAVSRYDPSLPIGARRGAAGGEGGGRRCRLCPAAAAFCVCRAPAPGQPVPHGPEGEGSVELPSIPSAAQMRRRGRHPSFWVSVLASWFSEIRSRGTLQMVAAGLLRLEDISHICARWWEILTLAAVPTCPSCGARYERADGCSHVQCSVCCTDFCHSCARPFCRGSQPSSLEDMVSASVAVSAADDPADPTTYAQLCANFAVAPENYHNLTLFSAVYFSPANFALSGGVPSAEVARRFVACPPDRLLHCTPGAASLACCPLYVSELVPSEDVPLPDGSEVASLPTLVSPAMRDLHMLVGKMVGVGGEGRERAVAGVEALNRVARVIHRFASTDCVAPAMREVHNVCFALLKNTVDISSRFDPDGAPPIEDDVWDAYGFLRALSSHEHVAHLLGTLRAFSAMPAAAAEELRFDGCPTAEMFALPQMNAYVRIGVSTSSTMYFYDCC